MLKDCLCDDKEFFTRLEEYLNDRNDEYDELELVKKEEVIEYTTLITLVDDYDSNEEANMKNTKIEFNFF